MKIRRVNDVSEINIKLDVFEGPLDLPPSSDPRYVDRYLRYPDRHYHGNNT